MSRRSFCRHLGILLWKNWLIKVSIATPHTYTHTRLLPLTLPSYLLPPLTHSIPALSLCSVVCG